MMSVGKWDLWVQRDPSRPPLLTSFCGQGVTSLWKSSVSGDEAVVCETESHEVGPDPSPAMDAKPAVPTKDSWAPSYEEKHP